MNEQIKESIERLKETIRKIEALDMSYWNVSLGTSHLIAYADQIVNDAKTVSAHIKAFGKK
ncbi:hypothetical protein [uncultured Duncaniella sp.]|uniref:hypothetical protein n=1 Tax=uncultured Duncaniella sp. TaxID=2768039 RepID=UPI0025B71883|nr:hypothetical protein [uncultured Duncaniella sp.]